MGDGALINDVHNFSVDREYTNNTLESPNNMLIGNKSLI